MAQRIDHTGHPHPSTPAARALCRANGGTGDVTPKNDKTSTKKRTSAFTAGVQPRGVTTPNLTAAAVPVPKGVPQGIRLPGSLATTPKPITAKPAPKKRATAPKKPTPPPSAAAVTTPTDSAKVVPGGEVPTPPRPGLAEDRMHGLKPSMKKKVNRVAAIQREQVGDRVVDRDIMAVVHGDLPRQFKTANATFTYQTRTMNLHPNLEARTPEMVRARCSHQKVRGGADPIETTIAHEMGHAFMDTSRLTQAGQQKMMQTIKDTLDLSTEVPSPTNNGLAAARKQFDDWFAKIKKNPSDRLRIRDHVSQYALANPNEFYAEVWGDYTMNPHPSSEIRQIGGLMKSFITGTGDIKGMWR